VLGSHVALTGQTQLTGDYQSQAKLTLAGFDVGKVIDLAAPGTLTASSSIDGVVTVDGPLKTPERLNGNATLSNVNVTAEGIALKSADPLEVSLSNGMATLKQLHITGQDTDLRASGSAQVLGVTDPRGGRLALQ